MAPTLPGMLRAGREISGSLPTALVLEGLLLRDSVFKIGDIQGCASYLARNF